MIPCASMSSLFAVDNSDRFVPLATADTRKIEALDQYHIDKSPESNQAP